MSGHLRETPYSSLVDFSQLLSKETPLVAPYLRSAYQRPFEKGSTLKGKNLFLLGANSFTVDLGFSARILNVNTLIKMQYLDAKCF